MSKNILGQMFRVLESKWSNWTLDNRRARSDTSSSVQFSHSVVSSSSRPHGLEHARLPRPSPTPRVYSNSYPSSRWCHPTILFSVIPFSSRLQSFPESGSFQMNQFFASGGQMNIQDWFPLGWTGGSPCSPRDSQESFNTTVQKHQFFCIFAQLFLLPDVLRLFF